MSAILENWKRGLGLPDTLVIDGHVHIGPWRHNTTFHSVEEAVEESVAFMDAHGIDAVCAMGGGSMFTGADYHLGNDFLLRVSERLPDRMIPFANVNPNDTRDANLAELDRVYARGIRGIKLINAYQQNYPGDGPNLMALYAYAADHGMLVFNHQWEEPVIWRISGEFPAVTFIFAHYVGWQDAILRERENVHANIWTVDCLGWLDRGIRSVGAGKFLLGSDGFLNPMSVGIGPVAYAPVADHDKRLILGLNMARLLDRVGALPALIKEKYRRTLLDAG
ncbi:MAG: hypothetical protein AMS14_10280 [Planctomycetes bacterium DG_20]|nr:MAG: hypothetical protein AMS14_10280 [Planctomycetes bacterium DG_20]